MPEIVISDAWTTSDINTSRVVISDAYTMSELWTSGNIYCWRIEDFGKEDVGRRLFSTPCWWRVRNWSSNAFLSMIFLSFLPTSVIYFPMSLPLSPTFFSVEFLPTSCSEWCQLTSCHHLEPSQKVLWDGCDTLLSIHATNRNCMTISNSGNINNPH